MQPIWLREQLKAGAKLKDFAVAGHIQGRPEKEEGAKEDQALRPHSAN
jgi:hypothetical protein